MVAGLRVTWVYCHAGHSAVYFRWRQQPEVSCGEGCGGRCRRDATHAAVYTDATGQDVERRWAVEEGQLACHGATTAGHGGAACRVAYDGSHSLAQQHNDREVGGACAKPDVGKSVELLQATHAVCQQLCRSSSGLRRCSCSIIFRHAVSASAGGPNSRLATPPVQHRFAASGVAPSPDNALEAMGPVLESVLGSLTQVGLPSSVGGHLALLESLSTSA